MSDTLQLLFWCVAAVAPLVVNKAAQRLERDRFGDAVGLSMMMIFSWSIYNLMAASPPGKPQNLAGLSFVDLMFLCAAVAAWVRRPKAYKIILAGLFLVQIAAHCAFWVAGGPNHMLYAYLSILNGVFALQLLTVAWPGGACLVRSGLAHLPHPRWVHHHVRIGPKK